MIVRIRKGVINVPVFSIAILFGWIIFIIFQKLWLPAAVPWKGNLVVLIALIAFLALNLLFLRWCTVNDGVLVCRSLFRKVEMPQVAVRIEFEKHWSCTLFYGFFYLYFLLGFLLRQSSWGRVRMLPLPQPRRIVLSDPSQKFIIGFSAYPIAKSESLKDLMDSLVIKTRDIDLANIKSEADRNRRGSYVTYIIILVVAPIILFALLMNR